MVSMIYRNLAALAVLTTATLAPIASPATTTPMFLGTVVHVSTDNIKVKDRKSGQVLSFVLVPHFKSVFSSDGKTTAQMSALTPGTPVTVYYDQKALGVRHADRILINGSTKAMKS
jgi:hypothetical protein